MKCHRQDELAVNSAYSELIEAKLCGNLLTAKAAVIACIAFDALFDTE